MNRTADRQDGRPPRRSRRLGAAALLLVLATAVAGAEVAAPPKDDAGTFSQDAARLKGEVEALLALLDGVGPSEIWIVASKLGALGRGSAPILANELDDAGDVKTLAIGRALCTAGEASLGGRALLELARAGSTKEVRIYAARSVGLTPELLGLDPVAEALSALLEYEPETAVRIAQADALLRVVKGGGGFGRNGRIAQEGRAKALDVLQAALEGDDEAAAREAALVLGENGLEAMAHTRLTELATEPTADGKRALLILTGGRPEWVDLLDEISSSIRDSYVDEKSVDRAALFDAAAKGMVESLDDFSTYLTVEDVRDMDEMLTGSYEGIGAYVGMRDGFFTIISPIYDGPAYRSGIRSLDRVVEVDAKPTSDLGFHKTIKGLKGPKGTPVVVKVLRRGWSAPQDFTIVREKIRIRSSYTTMLPGGIGYMRLARFGEDSSAEVRSGARALVEDGARSLVFDLRDNGGGLLTAAVEVADVFLDRGAERRLDRVIVYSQGRPEFAPQRRFFSRTDDVIAGRPLVVLVNSGSASASEIVAGSLQEWGRARLVGERTFGKGSVQNLMPLRSTVWSTKLRLTIARYYLPSGKCIDKEGVGPDVEIAVDILHAWESEAIVRSGLQDTAEKYVRESFPPHAALFADLAEDDGGSLDAYPGLREFVGELPDQVSENSVRMLARDSVRRRVADERGREFVCDLQEDHVLRRGVYELLRQREADEELSPALRAIVDEFAAELGKEHAASEADDPPR